MPKIEYQLYKVLIITIEYGRAMSNFVSKFWYGSIYIGKE